MYCLVVDEPSQTPESDFTITWTGNMPVSAWTAMLFGLSFAYPNAQWVLSGEAGTSIRLGEPAELPENFWDRVKDEALSDEGLEDEV
jgi:hypothetical protein